MSDDGTRAVHAAIPEMLDVGEIAVRWMLVIDVAGPDGARYLAHRAGGGHDGTDAPMAWEAVGMLQAALDCGRDQIREMTTDHEDDEPSEDG